jgi:ribosomal protein S18 acetylase RimI-like enzyme
MNQEQIQSPKKISFKKVSPEDWEKFREIRLKGLQSDPQAFGGTFESESQEGEDYWKERFSNPERCFYAAEEEGVFVATAGSKKIAEDNWMIVAVYTLPEFRGKNISKELIKRIIGEAKKTGAAKVSLMVNPMQESAVKLYEKLGFQTIKIEKDQKMGDGKIYDEYYMEKALDPQASN